MTRNVDNFNTGEITDSQQQLTDPANGNPANTVGNGEASQMLNILHKIQSDMQSMNGRLVTLEQSQGSRETETPRPRDPSERWADHMEGVPVPMYTEPRYDDQDEDEGRENENTQGTKLFAVSSETEAFLKQHFSERADNPTRRQWRERHGAPRLPSTACPKVDKILKQNLSSQR